MNKVPTTACFKLILSQNKLISRGCSGTAVFIYALQ